jgi:spore maturation protein CgeB
VKIVILGLSITSSWGSGHAVPYRSLMRALVARGHDVLFLERDMPWYAGNRDLPVPPYGRTVLYTSLDQLRSVHGDAIAEADLVMVGSFVPEGQAVCTWVTAVARGVTAFYDIDTPVTLDALAQGRCDYLTSELIPRFDLYLSFSGGPILNTLQDLYGARLARPLYCSVDPDFYYPENVPIRYELGYMGTYSDDRQPAVERLILEPARRLPMMRFAVVGAQFPDHIVWPDNVETNRHLAPDGHRAFYNSLRFTLSVTRDAMVRAGYSPSVRLFEAAACGTPIISDYWPGLETFFKPNEEILIAREADDVTRILGRMSDEQRETIGVRARAVVQAHHTSAHRALEVERYAAEARGFR